MYPTNPFLLPAMLMFFGIAFFIDENIKEQPNIFKAAVYVMAVVGSILYMSEVL